MRLHEIAFFTDDVPALARFYQQLLGTPPVHQGDGIAIFKADDGEILIHVKYVPRPGDPPCENHVGFTVADLDAAVKDLEGRGVRCEIPPRQYPWGRSAYLRDTDGHFLELHESAG